MGGGRAGRDTAVLPIPTSELELASAFTNAAALCRCHPERPAHSIWRRYRDVVPEPASKTSPERPHIEVRPGGCAALTAAAAPSPK